MAEFDLAQLMKDVSKMDTAKQQIRYLPLELIDPDPNNFYSLDGLEELAGSIEMLGLQQPLLVRPSEGGRFLVISGHRRRAAIGLIAQGGSTQFSDGVPCIIDAEAGSTALQELKLIMANADTRKMSSADLNRQAERIEDLLRQLEDEGFKFPGRLRDWVAKLSGMSRTKLARLKVIREKLDAPILKHYYDKGKMNESVAYELAQRPVEIQRRICDAYVLPKDRRLESMSTGFVTDYDAFLKKLAAMKCKINKGSACTNQERILEKVFDDTYGYKPCKRHSSCCADCAQYLNCRSRCPLLDSKAKAERAKNREASKDEKAKEKAMRDAAIMDIEHVWARFGQALTAAGLTDNQLRANLKKREFSFNEFDTYVGKEKAEALLDYSCTDTKETDPMPFFYSFKASDYRKLCTVAEALGCSLDYLFCRTCDPTPGGADPQPVSEADTKAEWHREEPPVDGRYLCLVDMNTSTLHEQRCDWKNGEWYAYGSPIHDTFTVLAWWPLPKESPRPDWWHGAEEGTDGEEE